MDLHLLTTKAALALARADCLFFLLSSLLAYGANGLDAMGQRLPSYSDNAILRSSYPATSHSC